MLPGKKKMGRPTLLGPAELARGAAEPGRVAVQTPAGPASFPGPDTAEDAVNEQMVR